MRAAASRSASQPKRMQPEATAPKMRAAAGLRALSSTASSTSYLRPAVPRVRNFTTNVGWRAYPVLSGAGMVRVTAAVDGMNNFVVVSGSKTKNVISYNTQQKGWMMLTIMPSSQVNACSASCR